MVDPTEKTGLSIDPSPRRPDSVRTQDHPLAKTTGENEEIREACRQFEEIFLRILLKEARINRSLGGGEDAASKMYGDMTREAMARALARAGGLGLADVLFHQLSTDEVQADLAESDPSKKPVTETVQKINESDSDR